MGRNGSPGATSKLTSRLANFMVRAPFRIAAKHQIQRLLEVSDQVLRRLQAYGQPNQAVADPQPVASFHRNVSMGCCRWMSHQRLDATEALSTDPEPQRIHHRNRLGWASLQLET